MKIMRNDVRGEGRVWREGEGAVRRGREGVGARGRGGRWWKTDKDKVRAKVGSWARKWWVAVVRVAATKDERARGVSWGKQGRGRRGVESAVKGREGGTEARRRGARSRSCNCVKTSAVQKHPFETCSHSSRQPRLVSSRLGFSAIREREEIPRDVFGCRDRRPEMPLSISENGILIHGSKIVSQDFVTVKQKGNKRLTKFYWKINGCL